MLRWGGTGLARGSRKDASCAQKRRRQGKAACGYVLRGWASWASEFLGSPNRHIPKWLSEDGHKNSRWGHPHPPLTTGLGSDSCDLPSLPQVPHPRVKHAVWSPLAPVPTTQGPHHRWGSYSSSRNGLTNQHLSLTLCLLAASPRLFQLQPGQGHLQIECAEPLRTQVLRQPLFLGWDPQAQVTARCSQAPAFGAQGRAGVSGPLHLGPGS